MPASSMNCVLRKLEFDFALLHHVHLSHLILKQAIPSWIIRSLANLALLPYFSPYAPLLPRPGNSPVKLLRLLAAQQEASGFPWSSTHVWMVDERCAPDPADLGKGADERFRASANGPVLATLTGLLIGFWAQTKSRPYTTRVPVANPIKNRNPYTGVYALLNSPMGTAQYPPIFDSRPRRRSAVGQPVCPPSPGLACQPGSILLGRWSGPRVLWVRMGSFHSVNFGQNLVILQAHPDYMQITPGRPM